MRPERWILLRGLSREAAHWGRFVPALAATLPKGDVEVVALDVPRPKSRVTRPRRGSP